MVVQRKQKWIPVTLIEFAERLAGHIRDQQTKGRLMNMPLNPTPTQILNMALARGLSALAEDVGLDLSREGMERKETEEKKDGNEARDFLKKLMGGNNE